MNRIRAEIVKTSRWCLPHLPCKLPSIPYCHEQQFDLTRKSWRLNQSSFWISLLPVLCEITRIKAVNSCKIREKGRIAPAFFLYFFYKTLHLTMLDCILLEELKILTYEKILSITLSGSESFKNIFWLRLRHSPYGSPRRLTTFCLTDNIGRPPWLRRSSTAVLKVATSIHYALRYFFETVPGVRIIESSGSSVSSKFGLANIVQP